MFLEAQLYLPQALEMALAAREELPPVPHSLPHPGRVTACTVQMPMETGSVIITRTDPVIMQMQMQTVTESVIITRTGPASTQMQTVTGSAITTKTDPASTQMQTVTESVITTRMDPASTQMQTVTGSVIIIRRRFPQVWFPEDIRRRFPQVWFPEDIMEPAITGDGETVIIKEGWKKRCEVRKKPEGPLICTGTQ